MANIEWSFVYIFRLILPQDAIVVKVRFSRNKPREALHNLCDLSNKSCCDKPGFPPPCSFACPSGL